MSWTKEVFCGQVLAAEASLYRVARAILRSEADCADAIQEGILKAYQNLDSLKDAQHFRTFLLCMAILTFLSRKIYNSTVPHVTVSGVESGRLTIDGEVEYFRYLVPNSAVVDGRVYLLESDAGAWGSQAHYARAVSVKVLGSDGKHTAVEGDIKGVSQVITGWNEPFDDGAEVYVND